MKATTIEEILEALKTKKAMEENGKWPLGLLAEKITMPVEIIEELVGLKIVQEHPCPSCVTPKMCERELPPSKIEEI
jgi:hypothetical protein